LEFFRFVPNGFTFFFFAAQIFVAAAWFWGGEKKTFVTYRARFRLRVCRRAAHIRVYSNVQKK
jgi:hypothetical protein